jgi:hypothetical protein
MARPRRKQIQDAIFAAFVRIAGFAANGASTAVTTAITTALSTAGEGGVSVPLQVSASSGAVGVIASGANNRVEIYNATSKEKIKSAGGDEVYGRLTEAGGVYTLTYYTLPASGTEAGYTFGSSTNIDFEIAYRFDFARLPGDAIIGVTTRNVDQDVPGQGRPFAEKLTVTATNTVNSPTKIPLNAETFELVVNGVSVDTFDGSSAAFSINLSTRAITWDAGDAGYSLETSDRVIARYFTNE